MADRPKLTEPRPLLDDVLPPFDVHERHETWVRAPVDVVYAAVKQVTAQQVRLLMPLEVLRGLPRVLVGRRPFRPNPSAPLLETFTVGVVPLAERPGKEVVAGAVGRFWRPAGNDPVSIQTREEFLAFARTRLCEGRDLLRRLSSVERQPSHDGDSRCGNKP